MGQRQKPCAVQERRGLFIRSFSSKASHPPGIYDIRTLQTGPGDPCPTLGRLLVHTSSRPWTWMTSGLCTQGPWRPELASLAQSRAAAPWIPSAPGAGVGLWDAALLPQRLERSPRGFPVEALSFPAWP